ncbi:MAG: transcription-repair coupling factor [Deltaproteobacteria bacterium]|nr:transcription-repair coupling factor [Deltaproteobacteria bacterium]
MPRSGERLEFSGLTPAAASLVLAELLKKQPVSLLVYLPTPIEAEDFVRDLEFFWPEGAEAGAILPLPSYEVRPFAERSPATELVFDRIKALYALMTAPSPLVVVCSARSALQLSLPPSVLSETVDFIETGQEVDRDKLLANMVRSGYFSTAMVQGPGAFSVRGGILDIYPPGENRPVRAEFFGDLIESLRSFRTLDQRSVGEMPELTILPASEIVYQPTRAGRACTAFRDLADQEGWPGNLCAPIEEKIDQRSYFSGLESFLPLFYERLHAPDEFAEPQTVRVVFDPERFFETAEEYRSKIASHIEQLRLDSKPNLDIDRLFWSPRQLRESMEAKPLIQVKELASLEPDTRTSNLHFHAEVNEDLRTLMTGADASAGLLAPLVARVRSWLDQRLNITLVCHTDEQARRMAELLEGYGLHSGLGPDTRDAQPDSHVRFQVRKGILSAGFVLRELGCVFVTEEELFGPKRRVVRRAAEEIKGIHLSGFQDLSVGDFVVHTENGVGQYMGLVKLDVEGQSNDYLHLVYRGEDRLYVPVDRFNAVQKYIGANDRPPRLDKLGGETWEKVKARVKASIREMAEDLIRLYATRKMKKGFGFSARDGIFREFEASFEYEETADQLAAINEVIDDMESDKSMDRLVCGDVGFGKTEVAMRAALKAVLDHKQAAVLVPTTVLAEQHFQTFEERFENYPVSIQVLSRFKTRAEQKEILQDLARGNIDCIIGTHRLLSRDVIFRDLGLLIIDEEHRFGVRQKEKIKKMRSQVDVLALSATPIPRTMQLSLTNIRDLSVIETPPQNRQSIKSYLLKYDEATISEAIAQELDRGGQVFFVHNRVKDIYALAARLGKLMPLVRFGVAHGQQKERDLEKVMHRFLHKKIDVLVTTTIIESGLDIPTANTIIINKADKLGMAQIYQLRGRVGRSDVQAHAYLLVESEDGLTRTARKRLKALMDFSDLGAGFKIALHDLQIRGSGNLLGAAQSGQIAVVGYEMYVQLIEQTIRELKGETVVEEIEPEMVINLPAYLPEPYIPDTEQRLVHYRRFSSLKNLEELADLSAELTDRYGPMPPDVRNLVQVIDLKLFLKEAGVKKLEMGKGGFTFTFLENGRIDLDKTLKLVNDNPDKTRLYPDGRLFLAWGGFSGSEGIKRARTVLQEITGAGVSESS